MIKVGRKIPKLEGTVTGGETLRLDSLRGQWVVVYFYPRDNTPGCTNEARDFRDLYSRFRKQNAEIVGVSRDSVASHDRFTAKHELPFPLVADVDEVWCKAFDVIHEKNLYGKKHMGVVRSTFLVDPEGKLHAEWRKVKVPGHAQAVLDAITQ